MIKLAFTINQEVFKIIVDNREIFYGDKNYSRLIRFVPKDDDFIKKIIMSRNKIPHHVTELFNLTAKEKEEYENAKTDKELAEICIKDVKLKGAMLIKSDGL